MASSRPPLSLFRKVPHEIRVQIWRLTLIESETPDLSRTINSTNETPAIVVAFRGHHDRDLYFEVLEPFFQYNFFQFNIDNLYGRNVAEGILKRVRNLEMIIEEDRTNHKGREGHGDESLCAGLKLCANASYIQLSVAYNTEFLVYKVLNTITTCGLSHSIVLHQYSQSKDTYNVNIVDTLERSMTYLGSGVGWPR